MKYLSIICLLISTLVSAQVTNEGIPLSWEINPSLNPQPVILPSFNLEAIKAEDAIDDGKFEKPWRFGYTHTVDYGFESGVWTTLDNGDRIWRLIVTSEGALSLNFIFDEFFLPEGGTVFLYNDERTDLIGAYTSDQNQASGILGTWLVKGEKVWIEYFEPAVVSGQGRLHLTNAIHGYRNAESEKETKDLNDSGDCNLDVDCPIGDDWDEFKERNKRSVGLLILGGGSCSGALVNNTEYDGTPYFLTANHCFEASSNTNAWAFRFGWISPNPVCAETTDSTDNTTELTISGSTLRARNEDSDFCLVEINQDIPADWDRIWAGWDKSDDFPTFQVGIHHPSGDIMKICRDNDPAIKAPNGNPVAQTWEIVGDNGVPEGGWELGVTEGGSSGSPLFDQNGRVIGQLYGGGAACNGTIDNDDLDYYGRFAVSWDGDSASERLRDWLDPNNKNVDKVESFPLEQIYNLDAAISAKIPEVSCGITTVNPTVTLTNFGLNEITTAVIEWNIDGGNNTTINFSGSLMQFESETFDLPEITLSEGDNVLNAVLIASNGSSDENSNNDMDTNVFFLVQDPLFATTQVHLELLTDDFPQETTWEFRNLDGTVLYTGGPYQDSNTLFLEDFDVISNECYVFEIFDEALDGICCGFGNGFYELTTDDDTVIFNGGEFEPSEATQISVTESLGIDDSNILNNITLYPNPVESTFTIALSTGSAIENYTYTITNLLGQQVRSGSLASSATDINVTQLQAGIYFMTVSDAIHNTKVLKFIKK